MLIKIIYNQYSTHVITYKRGLKIVSFFVSICGGYLLVILSHSNDSHQCHILAADLLWEGVDKKQTKQTTWLNMICKYVTYILILEFLNCNLDLRELCLARCAIISSIIPIIGTNLYSRNVVILRQSDTHNAHQLVHLQTTVYYSTTTYRGQGLYRKKITNRLYSICFFI